MQLSSRFLLLCAVGSIACISAAHAADGSDYGADHSVTRDRYSDKFMTNPGSAAASAGHRLPSRRATRGDDFGPNSRPSMRVPQRPNVTPEGRRVLAPNRGEGTASSQRLSQSTTTPKSSQTSRPMWADESKSSKAMDPDARNTAVATAVNTDTASYSRGFHEPLSNGMNALAPAGCRIQIQDGLQNTRVTWEGNGRSWLDTMRGMINHAGLYFSRQSTPCVLAVASSRGMARRLSGDRSDPNALEAATTELTYQQYMAKYLTADLHSASLQEVFEGITPQGWDVRLEIDDPSLLDDSYDITAATTRGQVIGALEQQLGVKAEPYVETRILIVSEK